MGQLRTEMVNRQRWHGMFSVCLVIRVLSLMVIRTLHGPGDDLLSEQLAPQGVNLQLRVQWQGMHISMFINSARFCASELGFNCTK